MDFVNPALAFISIFLGLIGWISPRYVMESVDLKAGATSMGASEIRAASGAMFVGLGVGAVLIGSPTAYAMMGAGWLCAGMGRATSLFFDGQTQKKWVFMLVEVAVGGALVAGNWPT